MVLMSRNKLRDSGWTLLPIWSFFTATYIATKYLVMGLKGLLLAFDPLWHKAARTMFVPIIWNSALFEGIGAALWYGILLLTFRRSLRQRRGGAFHLLVGLGVTAALLHLWLSCAVYSLWIKPHLGPPGRPLLFPPPFAQQLGGWVGYFYGLLDTIAATAVSPFVAAYTFRSTSEGQGVPVPSLAPMPGDWPPEPRVPDV